MPSFKDESCQTPKIRPALCLSFCPLDTRPPPVHFGSFHSDTHITYNLLPCTPVCGCPSLHKSGQHVHSLCTAATSKPWSNVPLRRYRIYPHSPVVISVQGWGWGVVKHFTTWKKLINKSKSRLHLAQFLYLRLPSMCLGMRSGGTKPSRLGSSRNGCHTGNLYSAVQGATAVNWQVMLVSSVTRLFPFLSSSIFFPPLAFSSRSIAIISYICAHPKHYC